MVYGNVMNHFHNQNRFADARAAEKAYLSAFGIGNKKVYYLNARFKYLGSGLLLA